MKKSKSRTRRSKTTTGDDNGEDNISRLPDDILISIISRLTLREATATNVLSSRWRHLHTRVTRLCFPPFEPRKSSVSNHEYLDQEIQEVLFPNYINMINRVLDSYTGGRTLKEFRARVPRLAGANIERWLEFALARQVEIIDMRVYVFSSINAAHRCYTFSLSTLISRMNAGSCRLSLPGLKSLRELSLSSLLMDDGDVELLLSSFTVLENLSLTCCEGLKNVSIVGHSMLKQLNISYTMSVQSVEIRDAIDFAFLRCYQLLYMHDVRLVNVPKLVEFSTCDRPDIFVDDLPRIESCILDQLLHLELSTRPACIILPPTLPKLMNLEHLELEAEMDAPDYTNYSLFIKLIPLIESCPFLEKLEMKFSWSRFDSEKQAEEEELDDSCFRTNTLNYHLKNVTLSGYLGRQSELQFASYIMRKAVALQELIIEPCDVTHEIRQRATARAWQHFRSTTQNSVNLVII